MQAVGSSETVRFFNASRVLTVAEEAAFMAGGGLPAGVGVDASSVAAEYQSPVALEPTRTSSVVRAAAGEYHFAIVGTVAGAWNVRGLPLDAGGVPLGLTPWRQITFGDEAPEGTVAGLVAGVLEDGQFDATPAQALKWLNTRHRQMCARARCYRQMLSLGATVEGQLGYPVPPRVVEVLQVTVGGMVYGAARHTDFAEGERGWIWLGGGEGGIAGREDAASGQQMLRLYPAPLAGRAPEPGEDVELYAAVQPPALVVGSDATLVVPDDYLDALVSGAIATGMLRVEARQDLAAPHEQIFTTGCEELLRATNRRYRGAGPARIRLLGVNA